MVFGFNGSYYLFQVGANHGTETGVVLTAFFGLFGTLLSLYGIGQGKLLNSMIYMINATFYRYLTGIKRVLNP